MSDEDLSSMFILILFFDSFVDLCLFFFILLYGWVYIIVLKFSLFGWILKICLDFVKFFSGLDLFVFFIYLLVRIYFWIYISLDLKWFYGIIYLILFVIEKI